MMLEFFPSLEKVFLFPTWGLRNSGEKLVRNFAKFTGKRLCQTLFFDKVAGMGPANLLKMSLWLVCFPVNFAKFLRTHFFYRKPLVAASKI